MPEDRTFTLEGDFAPGAYQKLLKMSEHLPTIYQEGQDMSDPERANLSDRLLPYAPTQHMDRNAIDSIVAQGLGKASVCWEDMSGAGTFDSTTAKKVLDEIMSSIDQHVEWAIAQHNLRQLEKAVARANERNSDPARQEATERRNWKVPTLSDTEPDDFPG